MDSAGLFVFLYGAPTLVGIFLAAFWAVFAIRRAREITHPWRHDRAFILSAAIAVIATGVVSTFGARAVGNLIYGISPILRHKEAYFIGLGLVLALIGFLLMAWLADLEKHPPKWTWLRAMLGLTALWAAVVAILAPGIPYG